MTGRSTGTGEYRDFVATFRDRYERLSSKLRGRVTHRPTDAEGFGEPVATAEVSMPPPSEQFPHLVSSRGIAAPGLSGGDGRVCVSWTGRQEAVLNAWMRCSEDARRWGEPAQLRADLAGETSQWLPQVAVSDSGRVAAVFYHHREDAEQPQAVDAYYAATTDPGGAFGERAVVSRLLTRHSRF